MIILFRISTFSNGFPVHNRVRHPVMISVIIWSHYAERSLWSSLPGSKYIVHTKRTFPLITMIFYNRSWAMLWKFEQLIYSHHAHHHKYPACLAARIHLYCTICSYYSQISSRSDEEPALETSAIVLIFRSPPTLYFRLCISHCLRAASQLFGFTT